MRASILLLPIALTTLASMPIAAQEAPRVIFCTGQCMAIDDKGVRTPAPKGTQLLDNQRLETGPGAYAQVKLGRDVAVGVGESAQVRFDQKSVRGGDVVLLDQGRIRMLDGATIGKPVARTLELRTADGRFALRDADIEVKAPRRGGNPGSSLTFVKLNVGDARLLNPQGGIAIPKDGVQGFTAGNLRTDRSNSLADVAATQPRAVLGSVTPAVEPVRNLPAVSLPVQSSILRTDLVVAPGLSLPGTAVRSPISAPIAPVVSSADKLLATPVVVLDPVTNISTTTTITKAIVANTVVAAPSPTVSTTTLAPITKTQLILSPVTTTAPTLTRTLLLP